jgi:hypothetical protein
MYFVVDYFKWGELNRWYFSPRVGSEGSREAVSLYPEIAGLSPPCAV